MGNSGKIKSKRYSKSFAKDSNSNCFFNRNKKFSNKLDNETPSFYKLLLIFSMNLLRFYTSISLFSSETVDYLLILAKEIFA